MLTVGRGAGMPASRALKSGGQRGGAAKKSGAQQANFPSVHRSEVGILRVGKFCSRLKSDFILFNKAAASEGARGRGARRADSPTGAGRGAGAAEGARPCCPPQELEPKQIGGPESRYPQTAPPAAGFPRDDGGACQRGSIRAARAGLWSTQPRNPAARSSRRIAGPASGPEAYCR